VAIATATHATLENIFPSQQASIDNLYRAAMSWVRDDAAKREAVAIGEKAAAAVLAMRAKDVADAPDTYRPRTSPAGYVPTATAVLTSWPQRMPWLLTRPDQVRPRAATAAH
jgi:hypothetical protein